MNSFIIVTILLGVAFMVQAAQNPAMKERTKQYLQECQAIEGASDDDLEPLRKKQFGSFTYKTKCVLTCVNEKYEFTQNGYVNIGKVDELANQFYLDPEQARIWSESTRECTVQTAADRCDRSAELIQCILDSIKRRGLEPKDFQ